MYVCVCVCMRVCMCVCMNHDGISIFIVLSLYPILLPTIACVHIESDIIVNRVKSHIHANRIFCVYTCTISDPSYVDIP